MQIKIAPSMVESDLARVAEVAAEVIAAGADVLHVDVADGHFVPNIMLGPQVARAIVACSSVPVGAHLMVSDPLRYAPAFAEAGADTIFFHAEAVDDLPAALQQVRALGVEAGVALKPGTDAEALRPVVGALDCIMVMTVEPGFSGQGFMAEACRKIPTLREMFGSDIDIYVDGGIGPRTVGTAVRCGANVMVAGYAVFHAGVPPAQALRRLRDVADAAAQDQQSN